MRIRPYAEGDAPALAEVMRRSVTGLAGRHYAPEQVRAWASLLPTAEVMDARCRDGRTVLVATDAGGRPVGFADLEADGHIDRLFCAPEAAGTGLAGRLLDAVEACARLQGVGRLHVEASEAARGAFTRRGFRLLRRRDHVVAGVQLHNYAMEKRLTPSPPAG